MLYKDSSPVGTIERVASYGGRPDKILNFPPVTVTVSGNVAVASIGVVAEASKYNS